MAVWPESTHEAGQEAIDERANRSSRHRPQHVPRGLKVIAPWSRNHSTSLAGEQRNQIRKHWTSG